MIYQALLLWQTQPNSATAFSIAGSSVQNGLNHDDFENTVALDRNRTYKRDRSVQNSSSGRCFD